MAVTLLPSGSGTRKLIWQYKVTQQAQSGYCGQSFVVPAGVTKIQLSVMFSGLWVGVEYGATTVNAAVSGCDSGAWETATSDWGSDGSQGINGAMAVWTGIGTFKVTPGKTITLAMTGKFVHAFNYGVAYKIS